MRVPAALRACALLLVVALAASCNLSISGDGKRLLDFTRDRGNTDLLLTDDSPEPSLAPDVSDTPPPDMRPSTGRRRLL